MKALILIPIVALLIFFGLRLKPAATESSEKFEVKGKKISELAEENLTVETIHVEPIEPNEEAVCSSELIDNIELSFEDFLSYLSRANNLSDLCLEKIGLPSECMTSRAKDCVDRIKLSRASLLQEKYPDVTDDVSILANKLLVGFFRKDFHNTGDELFLLSDNLLKLIPDHIQAHSIRVFSAILKLNQSEWDQDIFEKGLESSYFLSDFNENDQKSRIYRIYMLLQNAKHNDDWASLEQAQTEARQLVEIWPDFAFAYYVNAQLSNALGKKEQALSYLRKGLSVGIDEDRYDEYSDIYDKLTSQPWDDGLLTLRLPKEYFDLDTFTE